MRQGSRLLAGVLAAAGGAAGLFLALVAMLDDGPDTWNPVQTAVVYQSPPDPGRPTELHVRLFDAWGYTRTAQSPDHFDTEVMVVSLLGPALVVTLGAAAGWLSGVLINRRVR